MNIQLTFYTDPGHGWVEVERKMIDELGIADQISCCSYQYKDRCYLEEDCDAHILINALKKAGWRVTMRECNSPNNDSIIRKYPSYQADRWQLR